MKKAAIGLAVLMLSACSSPATEVNLPAPVASKVVVQTPTTKPASGSIKVLRVVDGDTIKVNGGETVRLIGIDTPERGQCGYEAAKGSLQTLIGTKLVTLTAVKGRDDQDNYGRLLRYVSVDGTDAGLVQLRLGLARARYDSRDGYGEHPKQAEYIEADTKSPVTNCEKEPTAKPTTGMFPNCAAARASGIPLPLTPGDPGWNPKLDRDKDGKACE